MREPEKQEEQGEQEEDTGHRPSPVVKVMLRLHQGCSDLAGALLLGFSAASKLNLYTGNTGDTGGASLQVATQQDAGNCQHILNECAVLCQRCESYLRWLTNQGRVLQSSAAQKSVALQEQRAQQTQHAQHELLELQDQPRRTHDDGNLDGAGLNLEDYSVALSRSRLSTDVLSVHLQEMAAKYVVVVCLLVLLYTCWYYYWTATA